MVRLTVPGESSAPARVRWPRRHATSLATSSSVMSVISLSLPKNSMSSERRFQLLRAQAWCWPFSRHYRPATSSSRSDVFAARLRATVRLRLLALGGLYLFGFTPGRGLG